MGISREGLFQCIEKATDNEVYMADNAVCRETFSTRDMAGFL
jgi:hypothetical protein